MPIQNPALRSVAADLAARRRADPTATPGEAFVRILALVGERPGKTAAQISDDLRSSALAPEAKLALVQAGLSPDEKSDLKALLEDPQVGPMFDATSANFLKALVGLEPLKAIDGFQPATQVPQTKPVTLTPEASAIAAVRQMRELVKSGELKKYYDAAIGIGDPALKDAALKLFSDLPKIDNNVTADQMVAYGLWTQAPKGIEQMQKSARYLPGRQVLVETTVHSDVFDTKNFLSYKEDGVKARTYRATLAGEDGDNFLVKVDGKDDPISVPKQRVYDLNQPQTFEGDTLSLSTTTDYASPFVKAKIAEAAIKMDPMVSKLDFTQGDVKSGRVRSLFSRGSKNTSELQRQCVTVVHDVIDMKYPKGNVYQEPGRSSGRDTGRQAVRGIGVCFDQASVMLGLLNPFREMLGVDAQFISGGIYRNIKTPGQNPFGGGGAHGWLQLTYRPSMELRICDRTWTQPDHPADRAYSRFGDRYPSSLYRGGKVAPLEDTDVDMSGKISVATFERQFGEQGKDGRENHMSIWQ